MGGAVPLLPLYVFIAWKETSLLFIVIIIIIIIIIIIQLWVANLSICQNFMEPSRTKHLLRNLSCTIN
jgi:hypothetical protein